MRLRDEQCDGECVRPVCRAERATVRYVPPEQRTADDPGAGVSGGESTNQANRQD